MSSAETLRERVGDHVQFCASTTKRGGTCGLPVVENSPFCWQHSKHFLVPEVTPKILEDIARILYLKPKGGLLEAAKETGISVARIRTLQHKGKLPRIKFREPIVTARDIELAPVALMKTSETTWTTLYGEIREDQL